MKYVETKTALRDKAKIKSMSPASRKRFEDLIKDILKQPREINTIGKPEKLKYTELEMWSRQTSKGNRIVYGIEPGSEYGFTDSEIIVFYQYLKHYSDK